MGLEERYGQFAFQDVENSPIKRLDQMRGVRRHVEADDVVLGQLGDRARAVVCGMPVDDQRELLAIEAVLLPRLPCRNHRSSSCAALRGTYAGDEAIRKVAI